MTTSDKAATIAEGLAVLHAPGETFEIRILGSGRGTVSGYFTDPVMAAAATAAWDGRAEGLYHTLNPVLPDLLARTNGKLVEFSKHTTSDREIVRRTRLPFDFDAPRPAGISSTREEHEAAILRAREGRDFLRALGWSEPLLAADSGNGGHLLYAIDLPNDPPSRSLLEKALAALNFVLGDNVVTVDLKNFNAARIFKCYGTLAAKGANTTERPHRRARVLKVTTDPQLVTTEMLAELIRRLPEKPSPRKAGIVAKESAAWDVENWIRDHSLPVVAVGDWLGGTRWILNPCPWNPEHQNRSAYLIKMPDGAAAAGCHHNGCAGNGWHELRDLFEPGWRTKPAGDAPRTEHVETPHRDESESHINLTDVGNAMRLVARHGADVRYCFETGDWYTWNGRLWEIDAKGDIMRRARDTVTAMWQRALAISDKSDRERFVKHCLSCESNHALESMILQARSLPGITITLSEFDADPWALNCANGLLNLRTGTLGPHDRAALCAKMTATSFVPDAHSDVWEKFLERIQPEVALRGFLGRAVGSALTGTPRDDRVYVLHGPGATGKTSLQEAVRTTLGGYARTTDYELFLAKKNTGSGGPRPELLDLVGARLVFASEPAEGRSLDASLIKLCTGGDLITARPLYAKRPIHFQPTFTLWLAANHRPRVSATDTGIWRRILEVPFTQVIPEGERDTALKDQLRTSASIHTAVLAWAVRGCAEWQVAGLAVPTPVQDATKEYLDEVDLVGRFLRDCCDVEEKAETKSSDLFAAYLAWCEATKEYALRAEVFRRHVEANHPIKYVRTEFARIYRGVRLVDFQHSERADEYRM